MELKYIDNKSMTFYRLSFYPNGVAPKKGETIKVTEKEKDGLLKMRNGHLTIFEEIKNTRIKKDDIPSEGA